MAKQRISREWLRRRTVMVFGLIIFGYLLLGSIKLIFEDYRIHQQANRLNADVENLEQYNTQLKNLLAYYQTDSYKEKEARARLNFTKPGEKVVPVPIKSEDDVSTITNPGVETQPATPPSNPSRWWEYFFGHKA